MRRPATAADVSQVASGRGRRLCAGAGLPEPAGLWEGARYGPRERGLGSGVCQGVLAGLWLRSPSLKPCAYRRAWLERAGPTAQPTPRSGRKADAASIGEKCCWGSLCSPRPPGALFMLSVSPPLPLKSWRGDTEALWTSAAILRGLWLLICKLGLGLPTHHRL